MPLQSLPECTGEAELLKLIDDLNKDDSVHGILVQLPLPKHINEDKVIMAICPEKDVDGFHPVSVGNMMIGKDRKLYIIDFNRCDFGDPWEEFNRIVWCAGCSSLLSTGMVNGYFDNEVPLIFWQLLALYISSNTLSSLPWAIPFGSGEVEVMINQANDILHWYDDMQNVIPVWYKGIIK